MKDLIEKYLGEDVGIKFWNLLISKINRKYNSKMMLRQSKDNMHSVLMVNTFNEFPKEFVDLVKKSAKLESGEVIDEKERKITLSEENWKNVYRNLVKS